LNLEDPTTRPPAAQPPHPASRPVRSSRKSVWKIALMALGVLILVCLAVGMEFRLAGPLAIRKVVGLLPEVTFADLWDIGKPRAGFHLGRLLRTGDPYASIYNPAVSAADRARGQELFGSICAKCHGRGASGGMGPALVGRALVHGNSDWAIYRTITRGVPGTAMIGGLIPRADVWRVMAYLQALNTAPGAGAVRASGATRASLPPAPQVAYQDLLDSEGATGHWYLPTGAYNAERYSHDAQINTHNVSALQVRWVHQFASVDPPNESTPIVVGDYLFVTVPPGSVYALDVKSGAEVWAYRREIPADIRICCSATIRGVSVLGNRVYFGTLDAHIVALDSTTGAVVWDREIAEHFPGYSITAPPLPIGDVVITGIAGGEFPVRGFISAYDAATGAPRWRFWTVPGPGEAGFQTWSGDSWKTGGASTWGTGAYDPELGLLYWGVGTAAPDFDASKRPGDNLYSGSILALNVKTGKLAWYFQVLPGDDHDWDSTQTPSLINIKENGVERKLLVVANRGGFFYVLDRTTGQYLRSVPFVKQTWASGISPSGKPIRVPHSSPSEQGTYVLPSVNGATNWWPSSYSPDTGYYYLNAEEGGGLFFLTHIMRPTPGRMYINGDTTFSDSFTDFVAAIDPKTAKIVWKHVDSTVTSKPRGGLLSTAGGLLFGSDGTVLFALDAKDGTRLWSFDTGGQISAPPVTFRIGERQIVAVVAGQDLFTFSIPQT
jgi:alcohol dehydrogenase (cytochrome c)